MLKKKYFVVFVVAAFLSAYGSCLYAQEIDDDSSDVVVLLDVSQSVLPYFHDVTDYVVSSVVRDYVRRGDVFHLLSFGGETQVELSQKMESESDVKSVLGRLYLMYPLELYSDFAQSLDSLYSFMSGLPSERPKVAVIITDGIQNPPTSSPTYSLNDTEITTLVESNAGKIRAKGWPVHIIKLPFATSISSGASNARATETNGHSFIDAAAKALGAPISEFPGDDKENLALRTLGVHTAQFPGNLGTQDYMFSFPLQLKNGTSEEARIELIQVLSGGENILEHSVVVKLAPDASAVMKVPLVLPTSIPEGDRVIDIQLVFGHGVRVSPREGSLELTLKQSLLGSILRSNSRILILCVVIALAIIAFIAIFMIIRKAGVRMPVAVFASSKEAHAADSSLLRGAAARSMADKQARDSAAESAAEALLRERREAAIRDAQLLAGASRGGPKQSPLGSTVFNRDKEEYDSSVEKAAQAIAAQQRAEAEQRTALLAAALPRYSPPAPSQAAVRRSIAAPYRSRVIKEGKKRIELRVEEQNPHIGLRNVHVVNAGTKKTVGGGSSDFLIFLVRVPRHAAELHFDGEKLIFVPRRLDLFPALSGPVEDCLGQEIPMVSSSGYPLTLRFIEYEEPAKSINRLLHCIDVPGLH